MRIKFVEVSNFRKLKSTHVDFDPKTTIFVGANNNGKTSAMATLGYFLLTPSRLTLRDVTVANWTQIDVLGAAWAAGEESAIDLRQLLVVQQVTAPLSMFRPTGVTRQGRALPSTACRITHG